MSIMILKRSIAIGVIALFLGMAIVPMSGAERNETKTMIPIELSVMNTDGTIGTKVIELSQDVLNELVSLLDELKDVQDKNTILDRLSRFFRDHNHHGCDGLVNFELLEKLPGYPIFSYGKGRSLLTRYHGRIMAKKLVSMWNYPNGLGTTVIWGDGITHAPSQILLKRQVGFMVGFVGLYMYVPPMLEGMDSSTFFVGSTLFAYGVSV